MRMDEDEVAADESVEEQAVVRRPASAGSAPSNNKKKRSHHKQVAKEDVTADEDELAANALEALGAADDEVLSDAPVETKSKGGSKSKKSTKSASKKKGANNTGTDTDYRKPRPVDLLSSFKDMSKRVNAIGNYLQRVQVGIAEDAPGVFPMSTLPGVLSLCPGPVAERIRAGAAAHAQQQELASGNNAKPDEQASPTLGEATYLPTPPLSTSSSSQSSAVVSAEAPLPSPAPTQRQASSSAVPALPTVASPPASPTSIRTADLAPVVSGSSSGAAPSSRASNSSSSSPAQPTATAASSTGHTSDSEVMPVDNLEARVRQSLQRKRGRDDEDDEEEVDDRKTKKNREEERNDMEGVAGPSDVAPPPRPVETSAQIFERLQRRLEAFKTKYGHLTDLTRR
ncbi:hypothetical protein BC829DRAFT_386425 [Chytridium lagenaria]|nr:hypothetical protein BC829DRAFT_386425 [Chytridium lagenaria]